eukprot:743397-Rhodomonas_salina.1
MRVGLRPRVWVRADTGRWAGGGRAAVCGPAHYGTRGQPGRHAYPFPTTECPLHAPSRFLVCKHYSVGTSRPLTVPSCPMQALMCRLCATRNRRSTRFLSRLPSPRNGIRTPCSLAAQ